jgi:hypothetical protein
MPGTHAEPVFITSEINPQPLFRRGGEWTETKALDIAAISARESLTAR